MALPRRNIAGMAAKDPEVRIRIVTGNSKVVDRGKGDGMSIATAGKGKTAPGGGIGTQRIRRGNAVIVHVVTGDHRATIPGACGDLAQSFDLRSDRSDLGHLL